MTQLSTPFCIIVQSVYAIPDSQGRYIKMGSLSRLSSFQDIVLDKNFPIPNASVWYEHVSEEIYPEGFVKMEPEEAIVPKAFEKSFEMVKNFRSKADDVWIITHPKSGNKCTVL